MKALFEMPKLSSLAIMAGLAATTVTMPNPVMAETGQLGTTPTNVFECTTTNRFTKGYSCTAHGLKLYAKKSRGNTRQIRAKCIIKHGTRRDYYTPTSISYDVVYRGKKASKRAKCWEMSVSPANGLRYMHCENKSSNHFIFNVNFSCPSR